MKLTKLGLAMASVLGAGLATEAMALDLYVDTKTQQIYAEPGKGRVLLGEFQKVGAAAPAVETTALKAEIDQIKEDLALKNNELKALDEHMKVAEEVKVKADKKGLQIESADGNFKFKVSGRLQADANFHDGDGYYPVSQTTNLGSSGVANTATPIYANDGTQLRRARLRFNGTLYKDWDFILEGDFANNGVALKDAFLEYKGFDDIGSIVVGNQKQLFSNELWASSNDILFMERSLMNVLNNPTAERAIGASFQSHGKDWYAGIGVFGDGVNTSSNANGNPGTTAGVTEGWGTSARATYAPINEKDKVIHLGLAGNYRKTDTNHKNVHGTLSAGNLKYSYQTTAMSGLNLLNASFTDVQDIRQIGLEAGGLYGPWSILAEYASNWMDTTANTGPGAASFNYDGYYIESAYSLTGESRKYSGDEGKFKRLKPKANFSPKDGNWGAFELAGRYSAVNLNDQDRNNGSLANMSVGLNWYMNENIRFMADFTRTLNLKGGAMISATGNNSDLDVYQFRGQWAF